MIATKYIYLQNKVYLNKYEYVSVKWVKIKCVYVYVLSVHRQNNLYNKQKQTHILKAWFNEFSIGNLVLKILKKCSRILYKKKINET